MYLQEQLLDVKSNTTVEQIGVGLIENVKGHGNADSEDCLVDVQFCSEKGAKPQTSKRPDTGTFIQPCSSTQNTKRKKAPLS